MIGAAVLLVLQAAAGPSLDGDWALVGTNTRRPIWVDRKSVHGPRNHRLLRFRFLAIRYGGYGVSDAWVDCGAQTMTITHTTGFDANGKVVVDGDVPPGVAAPVSIASKQDSAAWNAAICAR